MQFNLTFRLKLHPRESVINPIDPLTQVIDVWHTGVILLSKIKDNAKRQSRTNPHYQEG